MAEMTDRHGGTSDQGESCLLCGGGCPQFLMAGRVYRPDKNHDEWICPRCMDRADQLHQARVDMGSL